MSKEKSTNTMNEKWEKCIGCEYNGHQVKSDLKDKDYQMFSCNAHVDEFPCPQIPELYPHKLAESSEDQGDRTGLEMGDGSIATQKSQIMEAYFVEIYDDIECNIRSFVALTDDLKHLESEIKNRLKKRVYRHLKIFNMQKLDKIFKNYNVVAVPRNVNKIVYPKVDIEMDHKLNRIRMEEMVLEIERFPSPENAEPKSAHLEVDTQLSTYENVGRANRETKT